MVEPESKMADHAIVQQTPVTGTFLSFKTYFAQPHAFRFDWKLTKSQRECSIWFDGETVYRWMPSTTADDKNFTLFRSVYLGITVDEATQSSAGAVFPNYQHAG